MITCKSVHTGGLGRFGNQCFSIAASVGIAIKNGQPFGFPTWINQDNALFGDTADEMEQYFANPLPKLPEGLHFEDIPYHWQYRDYNIPTGNYNITSHLQDPRYFEHCMPLIRELFRMKDEPEQNDYIAIHYRAGDYIEDTNAYHPRCDTDYYHRAMMQFPGNSIFIIFTDNHEDAAKAIPGYIYHKYCLSGSYIKDFALMKMCKSFICANSSFSYFAALLGEHPEKKIVMPERWFGTAAGGMKFEGYCKNAIVL